MWRSAVQICLGLHIAARQCVQGVKRLGLQEERRKEKAERRNIRMVNFLISHFSFQFGGLAQLARAPALHAGGQRFESVILHARDSIL